MNTVELYSGTGSFSKIMKAKGHNTFTVDAYSKFNPDLVFDLTSINNDLLLNKLETADWIWMSPPCTTFSMASGNTHWTRDRKPKTKEAIIGLTLLYRCRYIATECLIKGKIFFIENPVGRARWFMEDFEEYHHTVWYCQYGDNRAKPTDIWTNLPNWKSKSCKNNNPLCNHERAPRGSKTRTQGLKGAKERGVIPEKLFLELLEVIDKV